KAETARSLAETMIGATLAPPRRPAGGAGAVRLKVSGLSVPGGAPSAVPLGGISLEVRAGGILGIARIAGNGQSELRRALVGETLAAASDAIAVDGTPVGTEGPDARRARGICFVPEERLGEASVADMALWENAALTTRSRMGLSRLGFLDTRK